MRKRTVNVYVRLSEEEVAALSELGRGKVTEGLRIAIQLFLWMQKREAEGCKVGVIAPDGHVEKPVVF